jgi:hypothetical protein
MASLFPKEEWFNWVPMDEDAALKEKARAIKSFIKNKVTQSDFITTASRAIYDWIDFGNTFAEVEYVSESHTLPDKTVVRGYTGPRLVRISPLDIAFDITASSFENAPKIVRSLLSLGQLHLMVQTNHSSSDMALAALAKVTETRHQIRLSKPDEIKDSAFQIDGFGSILQYYTSGMVEVLEFEGDFYDEESDTLFPNHRIVVLDRSYVLVKEPNKSWLGRSNKIHVGWRLRPDSLLAMGPLDNLVGMQYRVDHLENLKADVFDMIAMPVVYQRGRVEDWEWGPGEKIYGDEDSEVRILSPDSTALSANAEIAQLLVLMEEMAGAPKSTLGIRTPGEKTAYEVQSLDNASGRIYQNKTQYFERTFVEPALNLYLEMSRRNLQEPETVPVADFETGIEEFKKVTPEDIKAKGLLVPMGARHFAEQAQVVQNLTAFAASPIYSDPAVQVHISGLKIAETLQRNLNVESLGLVEKNVRLHEQAETQRVSNVIKASVAQEAGADSQLLAAQVGGPITEDGQGGPDE